jgi:hypothetical protein
MILIFVGCNYYLMWLFNLFMKHFWSIGLKLDGIQLIGSKEVRGKKPGGEHAVPMATKWE